MENSSRPDKLNMRGEQGREGREGGGTVEILLNNLSKNGGENEIGSDIFALKNCT